VWLYCTFFANLLIFFFCWYSSLFVIFHLLLVDFPLSFKMGTDFQRCNHQFCSLPLYTVLGFNFETPCLVEYVEKYVVLYVRICTYSRGYSGLFNKWWSWSRTIYYEDMLDNGHANRLPIQTFPFSLCTYLQISLLKKDLEYCNF
jgi:hypothetical protein